MPGTSVLLGSELWNWRSRYRGDIAAYGCTVLREAPICVGMPHAARATHPVAAATAATPRTVVFFIQTSVATICPACPAPVFPATSFTYP